MSGYLRVAPSTDEATHNLRRNNLANNLISTGMNGGEKAMMMGLRI